MCFAVKLIYLVTLLYLNDSLLICEYIILFDVLRILIILLKMNLGVLIQ